MDGTELAYASPSEVSAAIERLAAAPRLLVVSDFDGTLADFATDIYAVAPHPDAVTALERLATAPDTAVAVLSGRHLEGLKKVCPMSENVIFAGSHGAESSAGGIELTPTMREHLESIGAQLEALHRTYPHTTIEVKPYQRVFHTVALNQHDPELAAEALRQAAALDTEGFPDVVVGKNIVEYSAAEVNKGTWITSERTDFAADAVVFLGDDTTDETGFRVLTGDADLGVKVGDGATAARLRITDRQAVADFFGALATARLARLGR